MVWGRAGRQAGAEAALEGHRSAIDVTICAVVFQLAGRGEQTCAKGCAIDLHHRYLRLRGRLTRSRAVARFLSAPSHAAMNVYARSVAGYMQGWLCDAMVEYLAAA